MTPTPPRSPYECAVDTTRVGLERLARALLVTDSHLTSSLIPAGFPLGRGVSATVLVLVPDGRGEWFSQECRPIRMRPWRAPVPDGRAM